MNSQVICVFILSKLFFQPNSILHIKEHVCSKAGGRTRVVKSDVSRLYFVQRIRGETRERIKMLGCQCIKVHLLVRLSSPSSLVFPSFNCFRAHRTQFHQSSFALHLHRPKYSHLKLLLGWKKSNEKTLYS